MALKYLAIDDSTGKLSYHSSGAIVAAGMSEVTFEVVGGGVTEFVLTGYVLLTANSKVDVFRNGQLLQVGADQDYTIGVGNNKIVFNYAVPIQSKIKVKVFG
jgi:hypothetical protein